MTSRPAPFRALSGARRARGLCTASRALPLPRVLSGIQPTGELHVGNYYGALRPWVVGQGKSDGFFCVVDLHAITSPRRRGGGGGGGGGGGPSLAEQTLSTVALYLAAGVDPSLSTIFVQSHVAAHAELAWLLTCVTPLGWLERMTQWKQKSGELRAGESVGAGLLQYPVLMAADILLYRAELVPVGEDQIQHIELAQDIARRFNHLFGEGGGGEGGGVLLPPQAVVGGSGARVMSLADGRAKMSKSSGAAASCVGMLDPPDVILKKIKRAKTDSVAGGVAAGVEVVEHAVGGKRSPRLVCAERPEAANLLALYQLATDATAEQVLAECAGMSWGQFKPALGEALVEAMRPIQSEYARVREDPAHIERVLLEGQGKANEVAQKTLNDARLAMGILGT